MDTQSQHSQVEEITRIGEETEQPNVDTGSHFAVIAQMVSSNIGINGVGRHIGFMCAFTIIQRKNVVISGYKVANELYQLNTAK